MAEEVEITNYGKDGVASEETLAALLKTMERLAKSKGFDPKEVNKKTKQLSTSMQGGIEVVDENRKALDKHTDAVKSNTSKFGTALSLAGAGIGMVTNRVTALSEQLLFTGSTLTDFASEIPFIGTLLAPLTGVIDNTVDTYREFSTIGGTAGKSLYDFSKMAAEANMPMNDFRQLVMENSQSMKLFGSTTTEGMRNLSALSKEFRKGPGEALRQLGFTSTELNETLIDLAELNSNIFTMGRIRDKITAKSAADLSNTLFDLSAITGKRRDQLKDEMKQAASDYRARVAMTSMSEDEQKRFNANLTIGGATMKDALLDMADGIPQSDLAQRLTAMSSVFREKSRDIENMDPREMNNFIVDVRTQLEAFAAANGTTIQALAEGDAGIRGMLEFTNESKDLNKLSKEEYAAQLKEKAAMQSREDSILEFQEALNTLRAKLMDTLIDSKILETVQKTFEKIGEFFGPESTIFTNLFTGLDQLTPSVTQTMESFQDFLKAFAEDPKQAINDALSGIGKSLGDTIKDIFLGSMTDVDPRDLEVDMQRQGGLLGGMMKSLAPLGSTIMTSITDGISSIWGQMTFIEKVGVAAAGLFIAGGVIAAPLVSGIASLFLLKSVTGAMTKGAKGLWEGLKPPKPINPNQMLDKNGNPLKGTAEQARKNKLERENLNNKPKGGGGKGAGILSLLFLGADLLDILSNEDLTERDKKVETAGAVSGTAGAYGGASAGAAAGAWLGAFLAPFTLGASIPIGAGLGMIGGSMLGYKTGEYVGEAGANAILADENQAQPIPEPVKPIEPLREEFDSWWQKERKEEQNYKEAMKEYKKQLADYIEKTEEQKQTVDNLQMKNLQDMEAFRTESEKANQNLNTVLESFLNTAENQEKYSKQIAKNTGGLPSDVSANPTSTSRGRNAGRSGR